MLIALAAQMAVLTPARAQESTSDEFVERRARVMLELDDGILLLHARTAEKAMEQWGFIQDASFLYFSGLPNLAGAILALDGPRQQARLFVPPAPFSFGVQVEGSGIETGPRSAIEHGFAAVEPWDRFVPWLRSRMAEAADRIYLDGSRRPESTGAPPGMRPVAGDRTLWREAVEEAFPDITIVSARTAIQRLRWAKSASEVEILTRNAQATVSAIQAVAEELSPGMTQREAESVVAAACVRAGAQGPSFWPWTMSGPNAHTGQLVRAFFQYGHLNRTMRATELVRVDIGCAGGWYGADVGRTLPVDGRFGPGQREAWNLLIAGYRAGLQAIKADVTLEQVRQASVDEITRLQPGLLTDQGQKAARVLLSRGTGAWHIHGVGIESGEEAVDPLADGAVIAYEPTIEVGPDAFYLEDMILVTETGHRVLSAGLPYTAEDIERMIASGR
ncbi:MAG: hypothetical protein BMS9Abin29_0176 [Gemmatimonadota bacterium]|nr:MAG: hypothetical protein BMS9Abin29_0176 [Gemmatimonadota bacterium]